MELRRVRFDSIEGLHRADLGIAGEVWLRDVCKATWATRDCMKIAAHVARYMAAPDPRLLTPSKIEQQLQLGRDEMKAALRLMKLYRVVEAFNLEADGLRAALHLSTLQRLEVLEVRHRLDVLCRQRGVEPASGGRWLPPAEPRIDDDEGDEAPRATVGAHAG